MPNLVHAHLANNMGGGRPNVGVAWIIRHCEIVNESIQPHVYLMRRRMKRTRRRKWNRMKRRWRRRRRRRKRRGERRRRRDKKGRKVKEGTDRDERCFTVWLLSPGTGMPHVSREDGRETERSSRGSLSQLNTWDRAESGMMAEGEGRREGGGGRGGIMLQCH